MARPLATMALYSAHNARPAPTMAHNHPAATANSDQLATIKPATMGHARQTLGLPFRTTKKRPEGPFKFV